MPPDDQTIPASPPPAPWLRLTVGQKLAVIFFAFFLATAASLILVETLYNSVADASRLVNESGRLRYLSQRLAFYTTESALQKRPNDAIPALMERFDATLAQVEQESGKLCPLLLRQSGELAAQIGAVRKSWLSF
ncbi:MAG: type IV pili methyl-accepting chemotaxis transducer N-terminal domain-containing protein, partial [Sulfurimicrobium sp.]